MSDHPRLGNLRTTSDIIKAANASFSGNIVPFLILSLVLFSFRSFVETASYLAVSSLDRDPTFRSLLARLDPDPAARQRQNLRHDGRRLRHHRPFLQLTRLGTLDGDLFSEATSNSPRSPFSTGAHNPANGTLVFLSNFRPDFGFSPNVVDNGIRFQEIVRPGVKLKVQDSLLLSSESGELADPQNADNREAAGDRNLDRAIDLRFLVKGLELGHREAAAFYLLITFLSAAYSWVVLGFLVSYSWAFGTVFVAVVDELLGRFTSVFGILRDGSRLGLRRLSGFVLIRWAVRDALTQILGLCYFGEIEDPYSFFKMFIRLKLMPFSVIMPWIRGYDQEISGFLFTWFLIDTAIGFILALDPWIAVVDLRKSGREIVKEGCQLVLTMFSPALQLKCLEAVLCGDSFRWGLTGVLGRAFASFIQSTLEIYFMVAWLIFYLSKRCRDANSDGRRFELRELEAAFQGLR